MANPVSTGVTQAIDQGSASTSAIMSVVEDLEQMLEDGVILPVDVVHAAAKQAFADVRRAGGDFHQALNDLRAVVPGLAAETPAPAEAPEPADAPPAA